MFHGQSKPGNLNDYLTEFVREVNELIRHGVFVAGRQFQIHVQCIIADTPARAFLKSIIGHMGAHACERCTALGKSLSDNDHGNEQEARAQEREGK